MTDRLNFHRASDAERLQAYRNVHEFWGRGLSLEEHVERRLASVQHNRATWYVGCDEGHVATSLGCYPLTFSVHGQIVKGMAIGAVHTLPEYRGRGLAPKLFQFVEQDQREQGVGLSMLFSDIRPAYYERLGYHLCPSWEAHIETAAAIAAAEQVVRETPTVQFERTSPDVSQQIIIDLYESYHGPRTVSVMHDKPYFDYLNAKAAEDEFFLMRDATSGVAAYMRILAESNRLLIREFALQREDPAIWTALLAHVVQLAAKRNFPAISGWLPHIDEMPHFATLRQRAREITMLKPLDDSIVIDDAVCAATEYFVEIDHV